MNLAVRMQQSGNAVADLVRRKRFGRNLIVRLAVYALLINVAYVFLFPFLYMLVTSFKSPRDLVDVTIGWIPRTLHFENYALAFRTLEYAGHLRNSIVITALAIVAHLASGSFIGYGFARYRFTGHRLLFAVVILSLIVPTQTIIIPMYILYQKLGLLGSYLPILGPALFGFGLRGGLFVFIFRQFFIRLPDELEDAAKIDGCSYLGTFYRIVLPVSQPAILVSSILAMVWHWHDYYEPTIFVRDPALLPVTSMLPRLFEMLRGMEEELEPILEEDLMLMYNDAMVMAATLISLLPILVVFAIVQRYFLQGVERTGIVE